MRATFAARFAERTMAEWTSVFEGSDACVAPVLPLSEAAGHPHLVERGTYVDRGLGTEPAPAPRFSRTSPTLGSPPPDVAGQDTREALAAWGIDDVDALLETGAAVTP